MAPPLLFVAISLLSPCSAWSQPGATPAWPQPCTGFEFVSRGPSLTPSLSASPVLAFPASLVDYNSIWRLIYLHNRYRVPSMCQALARSWGTTNPTVGLFCFIRWKGEVERILPHTHVHTHRHTYIHTYYMVGILKLHLLPSSPYILKVTEYVHTVPRFSSLMTSSIHLNLFISKGPQFHFLNCLSQEQMRLLSIIYYYTV